jgi:phosphoribosylformimino-5-aminoimidazole carboxamide ribotide isomerase
MLTVIPAIDLKDGRCVRLTQGRADASRVYAEDPVEMARHWEREGAQWLHVVDLDGAFQGRPVHAEVVARIAAAVKMPLELGGGLRTDDDVARALDAGVSRAILGTRAFADPAAMARLAARFGARLAVGIDARDGFVQVKGWVETTGARAVDLAVRAEAAGVKTLIYTDTATDGMMRGPNLAAVAAMCAAVGCDVIASGGVTIAADVAALTALGRRNLVGAIVGKALYERRATLAELQRAATEPSDTGPVSTGGAA